MSVDRHRPWALCTKIVDRLTITVKKVSKKCQSTVNGRCLLSRSIVGVDDLATTANEPPHTPFFLSSPSTFCEVILWAVLPHLMPQFWGLLGSSSKLELNFCPGSDLNQGEPCSSQTRYHWATSPPGHETVRGTCTTCCTYWVWTLDRLTSAM